MEQAHQEASNVFAVDLGRASQLASIQYDELIQGIHNENTTPMQGIFVDDAHDNDSNPRNASHEQTTVLPTTSNLALKPRRSLVLAMAPTLEELQQRRRSSGQSSTTSSRSETFEGFVVGVKEKAVDEAQPLLSVHVNDCALPSDVTLVAAYDDEYTLEVPVESAANIHTAYLIHQPHKPILLAVPDQNAADGPVKKSLVRRFSGLPTAVKDVAVEATIVDDRLDMQICVQTSVPAMAYVLLVIALVSVSSQGAAMQALDGVPSLLKMAWRVFGASILFAGMSFVAYNDGGLPTTTRDTIWQILVCIVSYTALVATLVWALDHTSVSHAYIFNSSHSVLFVVGKFALGQPVAALEAIGAFLGVIGGIITSTDGQTSLEGSGLNTPTFAGDIVALIGAVGGVFYLTYAKVLRRQIGLWNFCFILFSGTWVCLVLLLCFLQVPFDMSTDPKHGFFGWIHHFGIEVYLVIVVSIFGTMGLVSSMKYFSALVVSVTMLLEPVIATVICISFGMAPIPGWLTLVGGITVIAGTFLVISNSGESYETTNVTKAVLHTQKAEKSNGNPAHNILHGSIVKMSIEGSSNVFAIDLHCASELAGVRYDELISGMHADEAVKMQGILMEVEDETNVDSECIDGKLDALVLTSAQTTGFGIPLCLQQLDGKTIIEHTLSQLLLAGIDRVVVAVPSGSDIRHVLEQSVLFLRMNIVFLDIIPNILESIPETVLAARHLFTGHFLIQAADRVFDKTILVRFDALYRQKKSVCMLVESNMTTAARMPSSTIRVHFTPADSENNFKLHAGRDLANYNGVDAGLYVVSNKVFLVLDNLIHGANSLSLPEALTLGFLKVASMTIDDQPWFSTGTIPEMVHVVENRVVCRLTYYNFNKNKDGQVAVPPKRRKSVVLSVGPSIDTNHETELRKRSSRTEMIESFEGFVIQVKEHKSELETQPLLRPPPRLSIKVHDCTLPGEITLSKSQPDEYTLAIPLPLTPSNNEDILEQRRLSADNAMKSAYLIQHPGDSNFVLAVPEDATLGPPTMLRRLSILPSDIKDITFEAAVVHGQVEMQLKVEKQVPPIGYVILVVALLSVSSQGAALQALEGVPPFLKIVWRYFGSSCFFGILTMTTYMDNGLPNISWRVLLEALICTLSYVVFSATFIWALDYTSVGHAYIFSNSHSIILVVGKCLLGQPVAALEAAGAFMGITGGVITSADHTRNANDLHSPSLEGDVVAFLGAIGGVAYLIYAKDLKETLGIWLFCFLLFTATWITMLPLLYALDVDYDLSSDPYRGFFGWVNYLGIEAVLVILVSACGSMGFVSALKYFPPLVVSVTMLLEPIIATIICIMLGMATIPGTYTFVGGAAVLIGTFLVIFSTSSSTETINVSDAVVHTQEHPQPSLAKASKTFTMTAATKAADAAHKLVITGLLGATAFGFYDITRGFTVMYTRNAERQRAYDAEQAKLQNASESTH